MNTRLVFTLGTPADVDCDMQLAYMPMVDEIISFSKDGGVDYRVASKQFCVYNSTVYIELVPAG